MDHPVTLSRTELKRHAIAGAWWRRAFRWLLRAWNAACQRAERKNRIVPYY